MSDRLETIRERISAQEDLIKLYEDRQDFYDLLCEEMEEAGFSCDIPDSIDFNVIGGKGHLLRALRILRRYGYKADEEIPLKTTYWGGFFRKQTTIADDFYLVVWLRFSSTACKRVQVGTETKEVPIFDIVCDEEEA